MIVFQIIIQNAVVKEFGLNDVKSPERLHL